MTDAAGGAAAPAEPDTHERPCHHCDPKALDRLKCHAQGVKAESDYDQEHLKELEDARAAYDAARHRYGEARRTAQPDVDDLGTQLEKMLDQLRCLVDNPAVIEGIDEAFDDVRCRLEACDPGGCRFEDDCDFGDVEGCVPEDIAARIADIARRTDLAKTRFTELIAEPELIATNVSALKAEVEKINTGMAQDSRTVDFPALYADTLVARYHQQTVYHGFRHVNAYMDCLCRTLTCQLHGHAAIAVLKRRQAVELCHQNARKACCQMLKDKPADEVMAQYQRNLDRLHREYEERGELEEREYQEHEHEARDYEGREPAHGERPSYGDRPAYGDRPYGERPGYGERRDYGPR